MAFKYILGVNQSTPTIEIYAELRRHPIQLQWKIAIIKYLKRLNDLPEDRLAKKAYRQLILDDENGHFSWFSVTNTIKQEHAIDVSDSVETIKSEIKSTFFSHLKENLNNCIYERKKLRTHAKFKVDTKFESSLDLVNNFKTRRCLTRFRLGVHDLEVERG